MTRSKSTEREAMAAALIPLGDFVVARGMERRLADYSRDEILGLIQTVVTAYHQHLQAAARCLADAVSAPTMDFEDSIPF